MKGAQTLFYFCACVGKLDAFVLVFSRSDFTFSFWKNGFFVLRIIQKAKELLCSEEGLKHRGQRCIEPEAVFGQMKNNMNYKRFRHFGKDKVFMDFAFFAIAFNIKKMCAKMTKEGMDWLIRPFYELTVVLFRC